MSSGEVDSTVNLASCGIAFGITAEVNTVGVAGLVRVCEYPKLGIEMVIVVTSSVAK